MHFVRSKTVSLTHVARAALLLRLFFFFDAAALLRFSRALAVGAVTMKGATLSRGLALTTVLSVVSAVPQTAPQPDWLASSNDSLDGSSRRALQAGGAPDMCTDDASFQAWLALVNSACCTNAATACTNGLPTSCDEECANVLTPVRTLCTLEKREVPRCFPGRGSGVGALRQLFRWGSRLDG